MMLATLRGMVAAPPPIPYRTRGVLTRVTVSNTRHSQTSELSSRRTARNGGVVSEAGSHVCRWPTLVLSLDGAAAENDPNTRRVAAFIRDRDPSMAGMAPLLMDSIFLLGWGRGCCAYETRIHHC